MTRPGAEDIQSAKRTRRVAGPMVRPPGFTEMAACKDSFVEHDSLLFPPNKPSAARLRRVRFLFCDECPVRAECLRLGQRSGSEGIWGGEWLKGDARVRDEALKNEVITRVKVGETDSSISRMTGVSLSAISDWRNAEGLSPNVPYGTELRIA